MYALRIKRRAERDLRRLPASVFRRINPKILALREEPYPYGTRKLTGNLVGWRIRVGDYRIVYQVDELQRVVTIVRVRHRRDVYR